MRAARRARAALVRGGAAALGLALVALLAVTLGALAVKSTGHQLLVVTSGSMEPYFSAGDALVVDRLDDAERAAVRVGDVVTFRPLSGGGLVTHRVAALRIVDGVPFVQTRGDANPVSDPDLAPLSNLVAHTQVVLPEAGRAAVVLEDSALARVALRPADARGDGLVPARPAGHPGACCGRRSSTGLSRSPLGGGRAPAADPGWACRPGARARHWRSTPDAPR